MFKYPTVAPGRIWHVRPRIPISIIDGENAHLACGRNRGPRSPSWPCRFERRNGRFLKLSQNARCVIEACEIPCFRFRGSSSSEWARGARVAARSQTARGRRGGSQLAHGDPHVRPGVRSLDHSLHLPLPLQGAPKLSWVTSPALGNLTPGLVPVPAPTACPHRWRARSSSCVTRLRSTLY